MSSADEVRRELDRARRQIRDLERDHSGAAGGEADGLRGENHRLAELMRKAEERAVDAERQLKALVAERDVAQKEAQTYKTGSFVINADEADTAEGANVKAAARRGAMAALATEVYEDINDILSELRNNVLLVQGEFGDLHGGLEGQKEESIRIISDAIEALVGGAEDAKGILRRLRELVEEST
jgi:hypothetical protein